MTDDPDLFGFSRPPSYPDAPGHKGPETSKEAAEAIAPRCGRLQRMTLVAITASGFYGLTADEAAEACELDRWSIQPRVSELKLKGLIADSGHRRHNRTGKRAVVWVAVEYLRSAVA